jgi:hypothetical protein
MHAFAGYSQRLATRNQHAGAVGVAQNAVDELGDRLDDLLAIVQHDQESLAAEMLDDVRDRAPGDAEGHRRDAHHERRVLDRRQIDKDSSVAEGWAQGVGDRNGQGGLADASGAGDRDKPPLR